MLLKKRVCNAVNLVQIVLVCTDEQSACNLFVQEESGSGKCGGSGWDRELLFSGAEGASFSRTAFLLVVQNMNVATSIKMQLALPLVGVTP